MRRWVVTGFLSALLGAVGCGSSITPVDAGEEDAGELGLGPQYDGDGGMVVTYAPVVGPVGFTPAGGIYQYLELNDGGPDLNGQQEIVFADYPIGCSPNQPEPDQHLLTITLYGLNASGTNLVEDAMFMDPENGSASVALLNQDNSYTGVQGSVVITGTGPQNMSGTFQIDISDQMGGADQSSLTGSFGQLLPCAD